MENHNSNKKTIKDLFNLIKKYSTELVKTINNDHVFLEHLFTSYNKEEWKLFVELFRLSEELKEYNSYEDPKLQKNIKDKGSSYEEEIKNDWKKVADFYENQKNSLIEKYEEYKKSKK
ncbi:Hypothetical protein MALK_1010 [Metamycoplasma alkalescens 14918]|uniref:Uncharacterized protein n=1 Tax=Metamycoplasma alkalescens 14918 TaxID=1188234 RepID=N9UAT2_9BACT|nr:hypothetical protein [Metamycoplasma alkalescens]ENY54048.1 Hypothetical protein MALK_1010 [Metamycoplasma alkalescens 14918]